MKMNTREKHWFFFIVTAIGAIVVVNLAILLLWTDMTEEERRIGQQIFGRVVTYGTFAMIVLFFISSQFILYIFRNYISPIETLTEETRLIRVANAKYRIKPVGALETHNLTTVINELADSYISLKSEVKNIVTESKEGFEEGKMRLDALMNIIPEGVIICNHDGRILVCNHRAYQIFDAVQHKEVGRFLKLGLGQSIFSVLNRTPIVNAFELLQKQQIEENSCTNFNFITTRYKVQFLDVKVIPILTNIDSNTISGYMFTINDISNHIKAGNFDNYPNQSIILDEIASIANMKTNNEFNFITEIGVWVGIEHLYLIDLLIELSTQLKKIGVKTIGLGINDTNKLQMNWSGEGINFKSTHQQFNHLILTQNNSNNRAKIELDIIVSKQEIEWKMLDSIESRPIFYNSTPAEDVSKKTDQDDVLLRDLTYVVFDTETTGLDPSGGDEIISIGGIRIYEGKINNEEIFDELVNPKRNIPLISLKIHEIYPEMLDNKPTIAKVLPLFHEFAKNTVLVAHNAAFDMKFIQLKEEQTGIKFNNPVLDTLLLSAVCHPKQETHNLEDIVEKLGIELIGRHTALGDAMITAEIFLKFLPILEAMGIKTLGEAREASKKTVFSTIRF
ncbi:MAG: hypothetical protein COX70_07000 [Flavobacteriales bacterium CG_4_10_14_0_2_um_filter_32_8]|nr:MAG: hypothetical protein COX70_07000 [Flavobacteriales bacterium CG_4_10_14_0_2_um_filter_32_8]PJB14195.1 MAG: hypothetical protein CO118_09875 [Flavobacteriales bacterium CG_4_9_14_3_um_filter_32_8]